MNHERYVNHLINKLTCFKPTKECHSPGIKKVCYNQAENPGDGRGCADAYDVGAVLAGTKPAASADKDWLLTPVGMLMQKRLVSTGMAIGPGFGFPYSKNQCCCGKPRNVSDILAAYRRLRYIKDGGHWRKRGSFNSEIWEWCVEERLRMHDIIGLNLGYPKDAVDEFCAEMRIKLVREYRIYYPQHERNYA